MRRLLLAAGIVAALSLTLGSGAVSAVEADRGVSVSVVPPGEAYVAVEACHRQPDAPANDGNPVEVWLRNRHTAALDGATVTGLADGGVVARQDARTVFDSSLAPGAEQMAVLPFADRIDRVRLATATADGSFQVTTTVEVSAASTAHCPLSGGQGDAGSAAS